MGPKPGCEVRFFPKRIKFDPPQQLIDSGEVWKVGNKWVQKCKECLGDGNTLGSQDQHRDDLKKSFKCLTCKGKGYKPLSGPTFPCALVIMDRRNV